jgi:hypothetical protein
VNCHEHETRVVLELDCGSRPSGDMGGSDLVRLCELVKVKPHMCARIPVRTHLKAL